MSDNPFEITGQDTLPEIRSWPETEHQYSENEAMALWAALATGRPLLLRGEPGTGKSQLARAAAHCLKRPLLYHVVNSQTESQDLMYHFDAVRRLADAQASGASNTGKLAGPECYLEPGVLWWAFDWASAAQHISDTGQQLATPEFPAAYKPENGCVLLIDEIDKADSEVPNGLLETLGNQAFTVPYRDKTIGVGAKPPLVLITTNEERELPPAFLRRCLVLQLELPSNEELAEWLPGRAEVHGFSCSKKVCREAATRVAAREAGLTPPGQAEYLDMLRALDRMTIDVGESERETKQLNYLQWVSVFALKKQPGQSQFGTD